MLRAAKRLISHYEKWLLQMLRCPQHDIAPTPRCSGQILGYGVLGDIIAGIVGAFIGGWLFGVLGIHMGNGLLGSIITAFIGAVILILILRAIAGMPRRRI